MDCPAFLLTNTQRECLGLPNVEDTWEWVKLKPSPYERAEETWACFDGNVIRRAVTVGPETFVESCYEETTTDDRDLLLPRTARGKAKKLSAVTLGERKPYGMSLAYRGRYPTLLLANCDTQQTYYSDYMESVRVKTFLSPIVRRISTFNGSCGMFAKYPLISPLIAHIFNPCNVIVSYNH